MGKKWERKIVFLLDIFHLSPSVGLYSKSNWFEVGWLRQLLGCVPWSFPSLETHPSQGCPCPPPSTVTELTDPSLAMRHRLIPNSPWQQSAAGTDESTCNQEFLGTRAVNCCLWDCSSSISLSWSTNTECCKDSVCDDPATLILPSLKH